MKINGIHIAAKRISNPIYGKKGDVCYVQDLTEIKIDTDKGSFIISEKDFEDLVHTHLIVRKMEEE